MSIEDQDGRLSQFWANQDEPVRMRSSQTWTAIVSKVAIKFGWYEIGFSLQRLLIGTRPVAGLAERGQRLVEEPPFRLD
jgi:hypothetical protein